MIRHLLPQLLGSVPLAAEADAVFTGPVAQAGLNVLVAAAGGTPVVTPTP